MKIKLLRMMQEVQETLGKKNIFLNRLKRSQAADRIIKTKMIDEELKESSGKYMNKSRGFYRS